MKTLQKNNNLLVVLLFSSSLLLLQSCVVYQQPREPAVKVADIVQMSKDGVSSKNIIQKIKRSHTSYNLKADQLAKLQQQGVSDSVVNYMEQTHVNNAVRQAQQQYGFWGPGWGGFYMGYPYYGYPYYGWPFDYWGFGFGPTIIVRGGGHFGGHYGGRYR